MKPEDFGDFEKTLANKSPDQDWPDGLKALWFEATGHWEASHDLAQEMRSELGSWIHAYLHRKEGDDFNAGYWYRRANRPFSKLAFDNERQEIVTFLLSK